MSADIFKQQAAYHAVDTYAQSGMILGLGMGSTAIHAVRRIAEHFQSGRLKNIWGVPCGLQTEQAARELGIPLTTLDEHPHIDVTFDGADEVDPQFNLIKGGGGALLREKIVAQASAQEIILVDQSKLVPVLGTQWALPIEVMAFGLGVHRAFLESLGGQPKLRLQADGQPFITDQGNYILDTQFGLIHQPSELAQQLKAHAGIVEHGLFIQLATAVIVSGAEGLQVLTTPA